MFNGKEVEDDIFEIRNVCDFMKREYPNVKGFNRAEIYRMKQFYETYKNYPIVSPLVTQLS